VAQAQSQSPGTDAYFYTGQEEQANLTQATIVHEALHGLTGKNDPDLYNLLTGKTLGSQLSDVINTVLEQHKCAGTN
jgi:hypothetical protein